MKIFCLTQIHREQHAEIGDTEKSCRVYLKNTPKYPKEHVL